MSQMAAAVTAGTLAVAKENYADVSLTAITVANVGDVLKEQWRGLSPLLKKQKPNLYLPTSVLEMYEDWYQVEYGHAPWNADFTQRSLIGSDNKCKFVPLDNMEGTDKLIFTVKANMKVGVDQESDKEDVKIRECDNPKMVQFFMMAYYGVGFDTLDKRFMKAIKYSV